MSPARSALPVRGARGRPAHSASERLAQGLGLFSIGLGLAELFAPHALSRALGMEGKETLIRAYGARECAAGIAILMSHDPTPWVAARIVGDAMDLVTLAADLPEGEAERRNRSLAAIAVAGVTALDVVCANRLQADKALSAPGAFDYGDRTGFPKPPDAMRGAASDLEVPADFRVPGPLRPWRDGKPAAGDRAGLASRA